MQRGRHGSRALLCLVLGCAVAAGESWTGVQAQNIAIDEGDGPLTSCSQLQISFDGRPALREEERVGMLPAADTLRVDAPHHGGVALTGGAGSGHEIVLCKAVPERAGNDLAAIRAIVQGSSVEVKGPGGPWVGYLIIRSPTGSRAELSAANGSIRVEEFEGVLTATTVNGPIALAAVRGRVTARAENGPVKLRGGAGNISLETQNGPVAVRLAGSEWNAGELVARAQNGPLSLAVPRSYRSGVEVESSDHAPWKCRGGACAGAESGLGTKRARFGNGPTRVRLSTVNGPVKVSLSPD